MAETSSQQALTSCPYCGRAAAWLLDTPDINRHIDDKNFSYYKCTNCGLVFLGNVPEDLEKYYAGGYQALPATVDELRTLAAPEKYRIEELLRFKRGGTLLEIGPWIGIFCANALGAGFKVKAIEANKECIEILSRLLSIDAVQSVDPAKTLDHMNESFDVIALWHSIEHLPRPWEVIRAAAHRLNPGGILLIAAPNPDSFQFKWLGKRWLHLDAPRHVNLLPPELIASIAADAGLTRLAMTTSDHLSDILSAGAWQTYAASFAAWLPRIRYLRGFSRMVLGKVFGAIFAAQEKRPGLGAGYTIILQRPA